MIGSESEVLFKYTLIRSRRRTLGIEINHERGVLVRAPFRMPEARIETFVHKMTPWVVRHLAKMRQIAEASPPRRFISGESLLYLGESYRLRVVANGQEPAAITMQGRELIVTVNCRLDEQGQCLAVKNSLTDWYQQQAGIIFAERLALFGGKTGLRPERIKLRRQRCRWGSCTTDKTIILNWLLVLAPLPVIDYVAAHELCHLKVHSHSPDFWRCLDHVLPDYKEHRKWLRLNGRSLCII
jgi:predicted metal-dependent hydrolase